MFLRSFLLFQSDCPNDEGIQPLLQGTSFFPGDLTLLSSSTSSLISNDLFRFIRTLEVRFRNAVHG